MTDLIKIFFEGREEILKVLRTNESIVKVLSNVKNPVCPLMGSYIKLGKKLGSGKGGIVFEIEFPDRGKRRYAAKVAKVPVYLFAVFDPSPPGTPSRTFLDIQRMYEISANVVISYNKLDAAPSDEITESIVVPLFKKGCSLRKKMEIPRFDHRGMFVLEEGDQICEPEYTEFVLAVLAGEIYRSGQSINFLDTFYFATCVQDDNLKNVKQYTFMEKIDRSLRKTIGCITEIKHSGLPNKNYLPETVQCIMIQILHAICCYQIKYQMVHGDLHDENVFLEYVDENTTWGGKKVLDADYYKYTIGDTDLYVPGGRVCPFIVKIGDWGLACKYSSPQIVQKDVINTGYDQRDGHGPWLPNFYSGAYDILLITLIMYSLNPTNAFVRRILMWILDIPDTLTNDRINRVLEDVYNKGTTRPSISALSTTLGFVNATSILTDKDLMKEYMSIPQSGNILLMGSIEKS